jgi:hypothetical protein
MVCSTNILHDHSLELFPLFRYIDIHHLIYIFTGKGLIHKHSWVLTHIIVAQCGKWLQGPPITNGGSRPSKHEGGALAFTVVQRTLNRFLYDTL